MKRRDFLSTLLAGFTSLATLGFCSARRKPTTIEAPQRTFVHNVHRHDYGFEFVNVPWSDRNRIEGQSVQSRVLVPVKEMNASPGYTGYYIETFDGLREIAKDDHARHIIWNAIMNLTGMFNRTACFQNVVQGLRRGLLLPW